MIIHELMGDYAHNPEGVKMPNVQNDIQEKAPGYETVFITRSSLSNEGLTALHEKIKNIIKQYEGEFVHIEDWGKKKLAYPISRETKGHYHYIVYTGKNNIVHEIERNLKIHEHVIRYLSVNLGEDFEAKKHIEHRQDVHNSQKHREEKDRDYFEDDYRN